MTNATNSVLFPADTTGCSFYRLTAPYLTVQSILGNQEANISITRKFITDTNFFKDVNLCMLQRQVSKIQLDYFTKFLKPLAKTHGMWVAYNVDDAIHKDDIPVYNKAWSAYQADELMENIESMMNKADILVVTTEYLKEYYNRRFNVPLENIKVIQNYIPHWWMGGYYDLNKSMSRFNSNKKKPRIGIISSSTHFDIENKNNGVDDISHIADYIRSTVNRYQWVLMGTVPPVLQDLVEQRKIIFNSGCDIMTYPNALDKQNISAIVAPLIDNEFNRCKSNIKLIEGYAMGIPVICQNISTYNQYTDMVFDTAEDLDKQLTNLFRDSNKYRKVVKRNRDIADNGNKQFPNGIWLENNLSQWIEMFKTRPRCLDIDLEQFLQSEEDDGLTLLT